ncbi:MAG: hypothetical protein MK108_13425 [Mariniblastus sp.]|nr:hypothetical protein [Mariniblastus sp.]
MSNLSFSWILIFLGVGVIFLFLLLPEILKFCRKLLPDGTGKQKRANPTSDVNEWIRETQSKKRRR